MYSRRITSQLLGMEGVMKTSVKWTSTVDVQRRPETSGWSTSTSRIPQWLTSTSRKAQSGRCRPVEKLSLVGGPVVKAQSGWRRQVENVRMVCVRRSMLSTTGWRFHHARDGWLSSRLSLILSYPTQFYITSWSKFKTDNFHYLDVHDFVKIQIEIPGAKMPKL